MSSSRKDDRQKQELLGIMSDIPGNDRCADCEAYNPDWASYSLGIFLCARCAAIHRKNSDVSKVKSISLDSWNADQVQKMREVGNTISNYKYNPLREWPMQDDDSTMERFIRDKYERQKFMSQNETANFHPVKSAMKGSAKMVEPGKSSSSVIKYSKELDTLREMGFTDRARNVDVLKSVMGDVSQATDVLVLEATSAAVTPKKIGKPRVRFTADTIGGEGQTPQMQAANPFDMWAGQGQAGPGQRQDFSNPFSSIPPSMYNNQNFVQNVQDQNRQSAPFMGSQSTGQDLSQLQFAQPAVPLRSQLTGGQPLRPQMVAPAAPELQQQQQQVQPLRHQLTGRPMPPPLPASQTQHTFQPQSFQGNQYQQNLQNATRQEQPHASQSSQAYQNPTYQQSTQSAQNFFAQQVPSQASNPPPLPSLKPQLTGNMRPKFQPTVDLNAPVGLVPQQASGQIRTQSPQVNGHYPNLHGPPSQRPSPQATGQYQQGSQNNTSQVTGQYQQPSGMYGQGALQPMQHQLTGIGNRISPQQSGMPNDPFGPSFTSPLRAELTGIQQQQQQGGGLLRSDQHSQAPPNAFQPRPYQPFQNQFASMNFPPSSSPAFGTQQSNVGEFTQFNQSANRPQPPAQYSNEQTIFPQRTGPQQSQAGGLPTQNTGGQGFATAPQNQASQFFQNSSQFQSPFPQQQTGQTPTQSQQDSIVFPRPMPAPQNGYQQQADFQQRPQNSYSQQQPQYGQHSQQQQFRPQQTGFQPQNTNMGINPAKPFDKASILSLYGSQQQQAPQQQQGHPPPPPPPPPLQQQQQQQQYSMNGYGQQAYQQQPQPQQGYNIYGGY